MRSGLRYSVISLSPGGVGDSSQQQSTEGKKKKKDCFQKRGQEKERTVLGGGKA